MYDVRECENFFEVFQKAEHGHSERTVIKLPRKDQAVRLASCLNRRLAIRNALRSQLERRLKPARLDRGY